MAKNQKNVAYAQSVKGINKNKKVYYQLVISVASDKGVVIPFKNYYLSEFESAMLSSLVGSDTDVKNDNIIATLKRGISQKGNVFDLFDVSLKIDDEICRFKQVLITDFERIALVKRCGFDTTDIESVEVVENEENERQE